MKRALRLFLALVLLAGGACAFDLARFAEIELVGPLANVVIQAAGGGRTRVEGTLASGETRVVVVPIAQPDGSTIAPVITFDADPDPSRAIGAARFVRWRDKTATLASLSAGLRARARPALAETAVVISRAAPLVLLAAAIVVVFTRRRPFVTIAVALVAAAASYPLVTAPVRDLEASVTLLDGDVRATSWRRVSGALDELTLAGGDTEFVLESDPVDATVTWFVSLDRSHSARVRANGTRLFATRAVAMNENVLSRARNGYAAFDAVWLREAGQWKHFGPWEFGAPLPAPQGDGAPPGWLASALPQGIPILIARERSASARSATWVRVSGL